MNTKPDDPAERETAEQAYERWRERPLHRVVCRDSFEAGAAWQLTEVERIIDAQIEDVENNWDALHELRWLRDRIRRKS